MNKKVITILSALAFIGGFLIFYQSRPAQQNAPANNQTSQQENTQKWETKTDGEDSVNIVVTPLDLSPQSAEWKFDIGMNTHSVELNQDMTNVTVLIDDQGKEYKPLNWNGPVGGHHREGVLVFGPVNPFPQTIELKIRDVGEIPERSFRWDVNVNLNK